MFCWPNAFLSHEQEQGWHPEHDSMIMTSFKNLDDAL
jgi:hypothetical protein